MRQHMICGVLAFPMTAAQPDDRPDLAAMMARLTRALIADEEPVLREHELPMWGYVVLNALSGGEVRTQAALAEAIGADKSRLIGVLDDLQRRGLIRREPDPADRRAHLLSITPEGARLRRSVQAAIRIREERTLAALPDGDREVFLRSVQVLAERSGARHERLGAGGNRENRPADS
jgi:DNA-binding MarR family transcriptional regulator